MSETQTNRSLGPGEKPKVRHRYVHMLPEDHATWTAYLESKWNVLEEVWYDVHVGKPMTVRPDAPAYMKYVVDGVSRKRIDVVGRVGRRIYIIEVKPEANMTAIGQVVTYLNLFVKEFRITGPVLAMIVATTCDADIMDIANEQNVQIVALEGVRL